ncbi:MAG: hypothetical protein M1837_006470 [Sclerophora amabilis]|nr:MAG: hypothetical protein M1837_006470 [Sclerophora amabilis]
MVRISDLNPLRPAKPRLQGRYSHVPPRNLYDRSEADVSVDVEKNIYRPSSPSLGSDYASSGRSSYSSSSRATSDSFQPMLAPKSTSRRSRRCWCKLPTKPIRYLSSFLILTILILILSLLRMSFISSKRVEVEKVNKKPPPAPWEDFPFLSRYYGGLRTLVPRADSTPEYPRSSDEEQPPEIEIRNQSLPESRPFHPYPDYLSDRYASEFGPVKDCFSKLNISRIPAVRAYDGVVAGFPDNIMGSYKLLGIRDDICFDRFGRLGPYGYGYSVKSGGTGTGLHGDREGVESVWGQDGGVDFRAFKWAEIQAQCLQLNRGRFKRNDQSEQGRQESRYQAWPPMTRGNSNTKRSRSEKIEPGARGQHSAASSGMVQTANEKNVQPGKSSKGDAKTSEKNSLSRTAFIIRTWWDYDYKEEDILYIRSLITELSLLSGGEYTVHFLVHVKDDSYPIWADEDVYQRVLRHSLPEEFWGLATLWTERQMGLIYGGLQESFFRGLPVHGAYRGTFLPLQWFAQQHTEYDFYWHWEMDARYTGHYYHFLDRVTQWAKKQPRKGLWERSSRFYVPSVDGSWEDFTQMVRVQTEKGGDNPNKMWGAPHPDIPEFPRDAGKGDEPVWGPQRPPQESDILKLAEDVEPPTSYDKDRYEWGVAEEADLITFNPMFDPDKTTWVLADDITGYNTTAKLPPRRAATITATRLSRKLLGTLHQETYRMRHSMFSEAWPASCALHHGYKAVYVPHPVYIDREWPTKYLASVFNGGRNGATGGARTSVFGDREHNFLGTTWFYNAGFAPNLWRRWLGFRVDNGGGEEEEMANEGRMCLPGMLLHPVKDVKLVVEGVEGDDEEGEQEQDPEQDPE